MRQHKEGESRHPGKEDQVIDQISWLYIWREHIAQNDQSQLKQIDDQQWKRERAQVVTFDDEMQSHHRYKSRAHDENVGDETRQVILLIVQALQDQQIQRTNTDQTSPNIKVNNER